MSTKPILKKREPANCSLFASFASIEFGPAPDRQAKASNVGKQIRQSRIDGSEFGARLLGQIDHIPLDRPNACSLKIHPDCASVSDEHVPKTRIP